MADNINSNELQKLTDDELIQVAGGKISEEILGYVDLVGDSGDREWLLALRNGTDQGEVEFLKALYSKLHRTEYEMQAMRVMSYLRNYRNHHRR